MPHPDDPVDDDKDTPRRSGTKLWGIARAHYHATDDMSSPSSSRTSPSAASSASSRRRSAALGVDRRGVGGASAEFETLIRPILARMPVKPERVSAVEGPLMQVTRIDDKTLDVTMTTSFRAHFSHALAGPGGGGGGGGAAREVLALPDSDDRRDAGELSDGGAWNATSTSTSTSGVQISEIDVGEFVPGRGGRYSVMTPNDSWRDDDDGEESRIVHSNNRPSSPAIGWYDDDDDGDADKRENQVMRNAFTISPEDVRLHERIAVGGFAEVFKGTWQGTVVAVKQLLERTKEVQAKLEQEVEVLAKLRHPNLLLFMGYCADPPLICTEFMRRGSLHTILKTGQALEPARNYAVATAVARGMSYLHSRSPPILHLDLKSPNILVDDKWRVKIADFGLARMRQSTQVSAKSEFHGTPEWMAPEMLRAENYDERADTYSFGVVLWELITARTPWAELHPMQVVAVVGYSGRALELPDDVPNVTHPITELLIKLFHQCAALNRDDRPMFPVVLAALERAKAALARRLDVPNAAQKPPKPSSHATQPAPGARPALGATPNVDALGVHLEFVSLAEPNAT